MSIQISAQTEYFATTFISVIGGIRRNLKLPTRRGDGGGDGGGGDAAAQ